MIELLVSIIIILLVFGLLWYIVGLLGSYFPQPFTKIAQAVILVILLIILIRMLLPLAGVHQLGP